MPSSANSRPDSCNLKGQRKPFSLKLLIFSGKTWSVSVTALALLYES